MIVSKLIKNLSPHLGNNRSPMNNSYSLVKHSQILNNASIAGIQGEIKIFGLDVTLPCMYELAEGDPKIRILDQYSKITIVPPSRVNELSFKVNEIIRPMVHFIHMKPSNHTLFYIPHKDCFIQLFAPLSALID